MLVVPAAALFVTGTLAAEETQEPGSRLRAGAGFAVLASPRPYRGAKTQTIPVPVVRLRYQRWFVEGIRGGYDLVSSPRWTVSAFAQARFQALDPDDSAFLSGMEPRRRSMDGGVELLFRGRPVGFRAAAVSDVLGRSYGQELSAQAITGAPLGKKLLVLAAFGPRWESARRVDYDYGVRPEESRAGRPEYAGASTVNWDFALSAIYRPAQRWSVFGLWNRTALGAGIRRSPIVDRDSVAGFLVSLTRDF